MPGALDHSSQSSDKSFSAKSGKAQWSNDGSASNSLHHVFVADLVKKTFSTFTCNKFTFEKPKSLKWLIGTTCSKLDWHELQFNRVVLQITPNRTIFSQNLESEMLCHPWLKALKPRDSKNHKLVIWELSKKIIAWLPNLSYSILSIESVVPGLLTLSIPC